VEVAGLFLQLKQSNLLTTLLVTLLLNSLLSKSYNVILMIMVAVVVGHTMHTSTLRVQVDWLLKLLILTLLPLVSPEPARDRSLLLVVMYNHTVMRLPLAHLVCADIRMKIL